MTDVTQNQDVKSTPETQQQNPAPNTPTEAVNSGSHPSAISQEEENKKYGQARKEGRASALKELFAEMGVASAEELKALKDKATALEQANMTESQKLQAERDKAIEDKKTLEQRIADMESKHRNSLIANALTSAAGKLKANDVEDVLLYARDKHGEALNELIDENGVIDQKKMDALLEKIKTTKPHYFTPPSSIPGSRSNADGRHVPQQQAFTLPKIRI